MSHYIETAKGRWRVQVQHFMTDPPPRVTSVRLLNCSAEGPFAFYAYATCHPKDQFNRKTGRLLRQLSRAGWSSRDMRTVLFTICPELDPARAAERALHDAEKLLRRHGYGYAIYDPKTAVQITSDFG